MLQLYNYVTLDEVPHCRNVTLSEPNMNRANQLCKRIRVDTLTGLRSAQEKASNSIMGSGVVRPSTTGNCLPHVRVQADAGLLGNKKGKGGEIFTRKIKVLVTIEISPSARKI